MNTEELIELQLESSQWVCKETDRLLAKLKNTRTNKERSKIILQLKSLRGRILMESHFIDKMIEKYTDGGDDKYDRGF